MPHSLLFDSIHAHHNYSCTYSLVSNNNWSLLIHVKFCCVARREQNSLVVLWTLRGYLCVIYQYGLCMDRWSACLFLHPEKHDIFIVRLTVNGRVKTCMYFVV